MTEVSKQTLNHVAEANIADHVIDVSNANGDPGNGGFTPDQAADLGFNAGSAETTSRIVEHLGGKIVDAQTVRAANVGVLPASAPRFAADRPFTADLVAQREIVAGTRRPTLSGRHYRSQS